MSSLENRIVLITGASSGIGLAAARMFAEEGATVVLAARNQERLSEVEKEFKSRNVVHKFLPLDINFLIKNFLKKVKLVLNLNN